MGLLSYLILVIFALVISAQDIKEHKIKNRKLLFYFCLLMIWSFISHSFVRQIYSGVFFLIFSVVVFLVSRRRSKDGIGFGDVKLLTVVGFGYIDIGLQSVQAFLIALWCALVLQVVVQFLVQRKFFSHMPMAPSIFLAVGLYLCTPIGHLLPQ
jgi:leader peptidase (prepilin peptidase)/N-methyltransferase